MANENGNAGGALKLDVRIPIDWHPSVLRTHAGEAGTQGLGKTVVESAASALQAISSTFAAALDAKAALTANATPVVFDTKGQVVSGTVSPGRGGNDQVVHGREGEFSRALDIAFGKLAPKVESSLNLMRKQRIELEKRVNAKLSEGSSRYEHDIRRALAKDAAKAAGLIRTAPEDDARQIASALLQIDAPEFLRELKPAAYTAVRAAAVERFAPEGAQLAAADKAIALVENARDSFVRRWAAMKPAKRAKAAVADDALAALAK